MEKRFQTKPRFGPALDPEFSPAVLEMKAFLKAVRESGKARPLRIALERNNGRIAVYETQVFSDEAETAACNYFYVERLIKTLLWQKGGWRVIIGGSKSIGEYVKKIYSPGGLREFDAQFMRRIYEKDFTVTVTDFEMVPHANESFQSVGRSLDGCRIGFDAGGSNRKVAAVIDGIPVFSEEVAWQPKLQTDPDYHYQEILTAFKKAATFMPRIDAIGVSAAGIYINNRVMAASLFMNVSLDRFNRQVKELFLRIRKAMGGVPLEVANDGDVTALAGAMELNDRHVLGIAIGTSEAGGYIDEYGNITGWLNELAFIPVDFNPQGTVDEWSGDFGCGVKYLSQEGVIKLAPAAGITFAASMSTVEKVRMIQKLLLDGDSRARQIFATVGIYLGYGIAYYAEFYDIRNVLVLGGVTSGEAGNLIIKQANEVLSMEFPELAAKIKLHLPDDSNRRVGLAIAAASLPSINKEGCSFGKMLRRSL